MKVTYRRAKAVAATPKSRFALGSPCRWIPRVDYFCHVYLPTLLRSGDTSQSGRWDRGRVMTAYRLMKTSPRWQHFATVTV